LDYVSREFTEIDLDQKENCGKGTVTIKQY
jgi:hypothetical protein